MYRIAISSIIYILSSVLTLSEKAVENSKLMPEKEKLGTFINEDASTISAMDTCYKLPLLIASTSNNSAKEEKNKYESIDQSRKTDAVNRKGLHGNYKEANKKRTTSTNPIRSKNDEKGEKAVVQDIKEGESSDDRSSSLVEFKLRFIASKNKIKESILDALDQLKSIAKGKVQITSGFRCWGGKKHRKGEAVDISYDETFIYWLFSERGQSWLTENHLNFFIEDYKESSKDKLPELFQSRYRRIAWATGLHIHLALNED